MNIGLVLIIIGFIFIIGSISTYSYFQYQIIKNGEKIIIEKFKKQGLILIVCSAIFTLGLLFLSIGYLNDINTIKYFEENNIVVSAGNSLMIYIGIILFGMLFSIFITSLLWILYLPSFDKKIKKYLKIAMFSSISAGLLFLLMFEEGIAPYLQYPLANQIFFSKNGVELIYSVGKPSSEGFSFSIAFYAIFILSGALLVLYICDHQIYKKYGHHGLITACFFIAFPAGIIGARAWFVIGDWYRFADNPIEMFYIWDGGLAIMGGAIFGIIAGVTFMIIEKIYNPRYKKLDYFLIVDYIVPTILVAQAIGRIGNFLNGEVHGEAIDITYWNWLPTFIKNNMHFSSAANAPTLEVNKIYVPLFLVEGIVNLVGYFFIEFGIRNLFGINKYLKHDYHANGSCLGWYIAWYGTTRAILEPMRYSAFNMGTDGNWSIASSYWMIGIGLTIVIVFVVLKILREKGILKMQWDKYKDEDIIGEESN